MQARTLAVIITVAILLAVISPSCHQWTKIGGTAVSSHTTLLLESFHHLADFPPHGQ